MEAKYWGIVLRAAADRVSYKELVAAEVSERGMSKIARRSPSKGLHRRQTF